jgi:hypothetical protein
VQCPDMDDDHADDHERQQVVQRIEPVERGIVAIRRQPERMSSDQRDCREEPGDDLTPR